MRIPKLITAAIIIAGSSFCAIFSDNHKPQKKKPKFYTVKKYGVTFKSTSCGSQNQNRCITIYGINGQNKNLKEAFTSSTAKEKANGMLSTPSGKKINTRSDLCRAWLNAPLVPKPNGTFVAKSGDATMTLNKLENHVKLKVSAFVFLSKTLNAPEVQNPSKGICR